METVNKNLQKIKAMSVVTWYNRVENNGYSSLPLMSPLLMALQAQCIHLQPGQGWPVPGWIWTEPSSAFTGDRTI